MSTFGVEEEFLLADPETGRPVPAATEVLKAAWEEPAPGAVHPELSQTQVEAATVPCATLDELEHELMAGRAHLAAAASSCGVWLLPSGTSPLGGAAEPVDEPRFRDIADRYAEVARDYQACGCHVHVGVLDRETAVAVSNHLRPWLATLLALSVNSPYHDGRDTGYASWRIVQQSRFPGAGVPPWFRDADDHDERVARLVDSGVLVDEAQSFWLVRPSPTWPTVELRVADTAVDVSGALLQATLSRALVETALNDLSLGREAPPLDDQVLAAGVWSAARYGLGGAGVHPVRACRVPATELLDELIVRVAPALAEVGDLAAARELFAGVLRRGTGAERQRAVGEPLDVVRLLAIGVSYED
ncbi:glutamate--cysteine ligase [Actinophytocola sp. NPDC049390]|uniref:glutamate--cysteine ligase n=1 Tax=Actinophytocola sp. NPDC049390 TaxID=3363894 RepID=UPI00379C0FC3